MSKQHVDLIASELENLLALVSDCPEHLQSTLLNNLCSALLRDGQEASDNGAPIKGGFSTGDHRPEPSSVEEELESYAHEFKLDDSKVSDISFVTFVAYYFIRCVRGDERVDAISEEHVDRACLIIGRKPPKNIRSAIGNAYTRGYMATAGTKKFKLTSLGVHYVKQTLLKRAET